jgi:hypothetical protein
VRPDLPRERVDVTDVDASSAGPDGAPTAGIVDDGPAHEVACDTCRVTPAPHPLVDFRATGRRVGRSGAALAAAAVAFWLGSAVVTGGFDPGLLGNAMGVALACLFAAEVVVVGGSALRGMLRAGERGERLADGDVGLLPTPLLRRRRRPDAPAPEPR